MQADTTQLQKAGDRLQAFYDLVEGKDSLRTLEDYGLCDIQSYFESLGFETRACYVRLPWPPSETGECHEVDHRIDHEFVVVDKLPVEFREWVVSEWDHLNFNFSPDWIHAFMRRRGYTYSHAEVLIQPITADPNVPFTLWDAWPHNDYSRSLRDVIFQHARERLDSGCGRIPTIALARILSEFGKHLVTEWEEACEEVRTQYKSHPNSEPSGCSKISAASSCSLPRYRDQAGYRHMFRQFPHPKKMIQQTFLKVEEVFHFLEPQGFGSIRSLMQEKGSKKQFRVVLGALKNMPKDAEFYMAILPYVESVMDRSWRASDREISSLRYGEDLASLAKVWRVKTQTSYNRLFSPEGLPGDPEAIILTYTTRAGSMNLDREKMAKYPSVRVLAIPHYLGEWMPPADAFPNVEKVYCDSWNRKQVEAVYGDCLVLKTRKLPQVINEGLG